MNWILDAEDERSLRLAGRIVGSAFVLVAGFAIAAHCTSNLGEKQFFDNAHWTVSYCAAAWLVWIGSRNVTGRDHVLRRWFAFGCTWVAVGQIVYDIQDLVGFKGVGPAELIYFMMVPCFITGCIKVLKLELPTRQVVMAALDAIGLTLSFWVITLTLFLPAALGSSIPQIVTASVFPLGMFAAISMGLVTVLTLRIVPARGWIMFLTSHIATAVLWFMWNLYLIAGKLASGTWFNALFSVFALTLALGAMNWRSEPTKSSRVTQVYEVGQRIQPLFIVLLTSVAFVFSRTAPGVTEAVRWTVEGATGCVVLIALIRQSVLLSERDRLILVQRQLSASEERYRSLIVEAVDGIVILDAAGKCLEINAAGAALVGLEPDDIVGGQVADVLDEEDAPLLAEGIRLALAGDTVEGEWRLRRADGSLCWIAARARVLPDSTLLVFCREITERKKAEAILQQAVQAQRELDKRLLQTQKMEAVGTLAAGIAHDFNNILGAIRGNADLLSEDIATDDPARESVEEIRKAGKRATNLVQQILAFSRQQQEPAEVVVLQDLILEITKMLRSVLPANVELTTHFAPNTPPVVGEPTQLQQVIVNLCTNAWQAMASQPGQIELILGSCSLPDDARALFIDVPAGRYVHLEVKDSGCGMSSATVERIFEPFFTTKSRGQGTGLGLAVARNIVIGHRGSISVESLQGEGTSFHILLPAVSQDGSPRASTGAQVGEVKNQGNGERIAYVDDEDALSLLVKRSLGRRGYVVSVFCSAEEALETIREDPTQFDVVITDFNMPRMSGVGLAQAVKAMRPELPVILTSGYISDDIRGMAKIQGIDQVVYKPDTADELCAAIHGLLSSPKNG